MPGKSKTLVDLDKVFSRYEAEAGSDEALSTYSKGRHIFDKQPALIGYVVACAVAVLGRLGMDNDEAQSKAALQKIQKGSDKLTKHLNSLTSNELRDFLLLEILSEITAGQKGAAVGRQQRAFYENAFKTLIELDFWVQNMEVCWRA